MLCVRHFPRLVTHVESDHLEQVVEKTGGVVVYEYLASALVGGHATQDFLLRAEPDVSGLE